MIRNLKTLGLAILTTVVLGSTAAPGAAAGVFTSSTGKSFTATGTEIFTGVNSLTSAFGVTTTCPGSTYAGHTWAATPQFPVSNGATRMTMTPSYVNCNQNGAARTVDMNGCDYLLANATQLFTPNTYNIETDVICPKEKAIVITGGACKVEIGTQLGIDGLHLVNQSGHIRLTGSVKLFSTVCGFGASATRHLDVTISGDNEFGESVDIGMST